MTRFTIPNKIPTFDPDMLFRGVGGSRGEAALVSVTYDGDGNQTSIGGLPDFADLYVKKLIARAEAAEDRIEALTEQRDAARRDAVEAEAYATELEAKLAKAGEALRDVHVFGVITHSALAVLAEIGPKP